MKSNIIFSRGSDEWATPNDFILNRSEIRYVKGRLKFGEGKNSAPFPSMIVIFRGPKVY